MAAGLDERAEDQPADLVGSGGGTSAEQRQHLGVTVRQDPRRVVGVRGRRVQGIGREPVGDGDTVRALARDGTAAQAPLAQRPRSGPGGRGGQQQDHARAPDRRQRGDLTAVAVERDEEAGTCSRTAVTIAATTRGAAISCCRMRSRSFITG
ncbi:hypothetical protein WKI65_27465 [Streptomyces sp. MS1.AVA.3]|uniref:hypothetical protein n=1 Tax=Streptomyces decoyicus TaxID=249567 RepID=UPI0030BF1D8C